MKRQFVDLLSSIGFLESPDPKVSISRRRAEQLARQTRGDGVIEVTGEFANRCVTRGVTNSLFVSDMVRYDQGFRILGIIVNLICDFQRSLFPWCV